MPMLASRLYRGLVLVAFIIKSIPPIRIPAGPERLSQADPRPGSQSICAVDF